MDFCLVSPRSKVDCFGVLPIEPPRKKTGLQGFRQGRTQTNLYSHRRRLDAWNFRFLGDEGSENKGDDQLCSYCDFVFAYAKRRFSIDAAQLLLTAPSISIFRTFS